MKEFTIVNLEEIILLTKKKFQKVYCKQKLPSKNKIIKKKSSKINRNKLKVKKNENFIYNIFLKYIILSNYKINIYN